MLDTAAYPMVWTKPSLTRDRTRACCEAWPRRRIAVDDEVYLFGGASVQGHLNDVHVLQLAAGNDLFDIQKPVCVRLFACAGERPDHTRCGILHLDSTLESRISVPMLAARCVNCAKGVAW